MTESLLTAGITQALRTVSSGDGQRITVLSDPGEQVSSRDADPGSWFGDGLHRHACTEMCFAVEGDCRLWTADAYLPVKTNQLVIIPPNTMHSEGWAAFTTSHRLLWLVPVGDAVHAFMDSYSPSGGWKIEDSVVVRNAGGEIVSRAVADISVGSGVNELVPRYLLQGGLLVMLGSLLHHASIPDFKTNRDRRGELVAQVRGYLELHYSEPVTVDSVAALFRLSPNYLNSIFSELEGMGVHAFLLQRRLEVANQLLARNELLIKEVAHRVGFTDPLYFCRLYRKRFGTTPSATRKSSIASG